MADTASVLHHFNDSTLKHENYSFDPLSSPSPSNEHLPLVNMARVTFERRTVGKPELHTGSSEQEKKFALQNGWASGVPSVAGHRQKDYNQVQQHRKMYPAGCSNGNKKLTYGQIML